MKYLKKYNESRVQSLIDDLNDISYELKDIGFNFKIDTFVDRFIIANILPGEKDEVDSDLIEVIKRMIECAYIKSYDLGSNKWYDGLQDKLRVKRKVSSAYYVISVKELDEFIGVDFEIIELVFDSIV
jgi:hypothetical protein